MDVGEPVGVVAVELPHELADERVCIPNQVWGCGNGSTWCTIKGYAPRAVLEGRQGVYVLVDDVGHIAYPFTKQCLNMFLPKRLKGAIHKRARATRPPPMQQGSSGTTQQVLDRSLERRQLSVAEQGIIDAELAGMTYQK